MSDGIVSSVHIRKIKKRRLMFFYDVTSLITIRLLHKTFVALLFAYYVFLCVDNDVFKSGPMTYFRKRKTIAL